MGNTVTATCDWPLWGTQARLVVTDPLLMPRARRVTDHVLALVDRAANRFRADSELMTLAPDADGQVEVGPVLAHLLQEALTAAYRTGGAVDPTVGRAMLDLGYDRDIALVAAESGPPLAVVRPAPGWRRLSLAGRRLCVPPGVTLDLGATAKAVAADWCAAAVAAELGTGTLVSLGGDIATAGPAPRWGWQVAVLDQAGDPPQQISLFTGGAVATSSTQQRTWRRGERALHHVVDPASGWPVEPIWRSVSVLARSCVEANTVATASLVLGRAAPAWIRRVGLPVRLVGGDDSLVVLNGWPPEVAA